MQESQLLLSFWPFLHPTFLSSTKNLEDFHFHVDFPGLSPLVLKLLKW